MKVLQRVNIPFHSIILPALLLGNDAGWHLPDQIVSSEYLTLVKAVAEAEDGTKSVVKINTVKEINVKIDTLYVTVGQLIEKGAFKDAVNEIFEFVRAANKYFDTEQPWITRNTDEAACKNTLYQCVQMIANLAVLLSPFLPFSSEKVCKWLNLDQRWERQSVSAGFQLPEIEILFQRIDKKVIEEEKVKFEALLKKQ